MKRELIHYGNQRPGYVVTAGKAHFVVCAKERPKANLL